MANTDLTIISATSDRDLIFKGVDGGSVITALTLDMSDAGTAIFNNKVGIGTSSPDCKLHTLESTNNSGSTGLANGGLQIENTNTTSGSWSQLHLRSVAYDAHLRLLNDGTLKIMTDGNTSAMTILDGGNVGIGVASPASRLHVYSSAATSAPKDQYALALFDDTEGRIQVRATNSGSDGAVVGLSTGSHNWGLMATAAGTFSNAFAIGYVDTSTDGNVFGVSSMSEKLIITTSGNVGIGVTSSYPLTVQSGTGGSNHAIALRNNSTNNLARLGFLQQDSATAAYTSIDGDGRSTGYLRFNTNDTERMRIKSDGQITTQGDILPAGDVIMANGRGISFAATSNGSGSMSSELLDDYEEGTWTPTLLTGSGTFSGATYTKVGRMVTCNFILGSITNRTSSAAFIIESLPFAAYSGDRCATLGAIARNIGSGFASFDGAYFDTTTRLSFYSTSTGGYRQLLHSDLAASTTTMYVAFTYMAA